MSKKKILFAAVDIGWRIEHYTQFIHEKFHGELKAESFVKFKLPENHYKTNYTHVIQYYKYPKPVQWIISLAFFLYALNRYDIFYFLSGETILTRKLMKYELALYKFFGKRIIMHFVGTDLRNPEILYWRNQHVNDYLSNNLTQQPPEQNLWQKKLSALAEKYADFVFVSTPDLLRFLSKKNNVIFMPVFLDVERFEKEFELHKIKKDDSKITILHAPSNPKVKGSDYIEKILKEIAQTEKDVKIIVTSSKEYKKTARPPYTVSRYELMQLYGVADIVVDQILIGWYGLQSVESLWLNRETVCYIEPKLKKLYWQIDNPIYSCERGLKQAVLSAINNIRNNKKKNYQNFVKKHHNINNSNLHQYIRQLI